MNDKELDNIHQLISYPNTSKLGFKLAEGFGYDALDLIRLLWDKKSRCNCEDTWKLKFNNMTLIKRNRALLNKWSITVISDPYQHQKGPWRFEETAFKWLMLKLKL